ncbi:MAG TPA: protein kinase, partial [Gemmatimonadales bacterium]|nr:protein kinase [Gemmatimonadales bacterium]
MSRVFLAEEVGLQRQVVVKVLPPEMAAGVNQDRFRREIQLAARLQHPHIVPLLTAGSAGDILYYVMPYIKGESLRAKLAREGELPVAEAARILREVTDALSYAHDEGVVHRDIKPDNVMIAGEHALVTDFGVAKAVTDSTGGTSLTSLGMALGTPAYMSPEQASGDPHVDHRADLYSLGAMAFEMLTGAPPFSAPTPQAMLSAHVTKAPERVGAIRPAVPPALEGLVMRCLEKRPADRWQNAREILPHLSAVLTPTGGTQPVPVVPTLSSGTEAALRRSHPGRVVVLYGLASVGLLALVWVLVQSIGLPDWVFFGAIGLVLAGLPVMYVTSRHERQRALTRATGLQTVTPTGLARHLTWRRSLLGGVGAFAVLGVAAVGYMGMRAFGIGPVGTLMAKGTMAERERVVLAEFDNATPDSTLGSTVSQLLRIDLAQSPVMSVYDQSQTAAVLQRMQLDPSTRVDFNLAREIATREGLKAVLAGEIRPLGSGYVLSARLVNAGSGEVLWAGRQDVASADGLSAGIAQLSATLRERVGESLRSIRASAPLDQVTTRSTEALRSYIEAQRATDRGDENSAIALLERAIAEDSTFAMAWRRLGVTLGNQGRDTARRNLAYTRAWELRDRLSPRERYHTEATYTAWVRHDTAAAIGAYQAVLEKFPDDYAALNNLALWFNAQGREAEALAIYKRAINLGAAPYATFGNVIPLEYRLGSPDTALALIDKFATAFPDHPQPRIQRANLLAALEQYDSAQAILEQLRERLRGNVRWEPAAINSLGNLQRTRGRLQEAAKLSAESFRLFLQRSPSFAAGVDRQDLMEAARLGTEAEHAMAFAGDTERARELYDRAVRLLPQQRFPVNDRDWLGEAMFFARAGLVDRAREMIRAWERDVTDSVRRDPPLNRIRVDAVIATAEGRYDEAIGTYRRLRDRQPSCRPCELYDMGEAYDRSNRPDSAIAHFERLLAVRALGAGPFMKPVMLRRLGQLYEARGDRD